MGSIVKHSRLVLLLMVVLFTTGCFGEREQVMVPPRADLKGANRLAVLYLSNYTSDPGIVLELEQGIRNRLRGYYRMVDSSEVDTFLDRYGYDRGDRVSSDLIYRLGRELKVDAVIVGDISYYFEDVSQDVPKLTSTYDNGQKGRWSVRQETEALVVLSARVIETRNGTILYSTKVEGRDATSSTTMLNYAGLESPPASMVPRPSRRDIPRTRMGAINEAVDFFTADLLPTYVWRRVD